MAWVWFDMTIASDKYRFDAARAASVAKGDFPASSNQVRYVLAELSGTGSYMIPVGHLVEGPFDELGFRRAARALVLRHDALRTRFQVADGGVRAVVGAEPEFRLHLNRMSDAGLSAFRDWALPLIFEDVDPREPGSLIRFLAADYGDRWRFTIAAHHAITDGFSRGTMNKELLKLYAGEALPDARSYYDFALPFSRGAAVSGEVAALVGDLPSPAQIVGDGVAGDTETAGQFVIRSFEAQQGELRSVCKGLGTTKFGLLTAVYTLALSRFSIGDGVSTFFQTEGRKALGAPTSVVGPFSNTLPLSADTDPDRAFGDLARDLADLTKRTVALEAEPILDATIAAGKAPGVSINMFPPAGSVMAGDLTIGPREFLDRRTEYDLNLVWSEDQGVLNARAFFDAATLSEERVTLFLDFLSRILDAVIADPDRPCRAILRAAREGHESAAPRTGRDPGPETRLHERFFALAETAPDAVAIVTSRGTMSYRDLAGRALDVLGSLQGQGVGPSDRVAILAERHADLVAAMLGVSASGASFAILDASYPAPRLRAMLEQLGARWIIEAGADTPAELLSLPVERVVVFEGARREAAPVDGPPRAEVCHLFTSGTTGQPKLKTHPDKTVQRFVEWQADTLALERPIVTLMLSGVSHDPTLRDMLLPLSHGGSVAIPDAREMRDPEVLRRLVDGAACNVVRLSPTTARLLTAGMGPGATFASLGGIFWGGERIPYTVVDQWREIAPGARQFHIFGTTETPTAFLIHEIEPGAARRRHVPLGRPVPWTGVRVIDEAGLPVAFGEVGEIVAELADPVKGVDCRFPAAGQDPDCQHCTGDLGYMTPDGLVWFLGRRDGQIKINDYRIEPAEIEAVAEQMPGVRRAVVVPEEGHLRLFVLSEASNVTEAAVRRFIGRFLPGHMVPGRATIVDHIPATPNGKVDRAGLLAMPGRAAAPRADRAPEAPSGQAEAAIAAVFARHSGLAVRDRDQSLFDLGADSLAAIEARMELEALGADLPDDWQWQPIRALGLRTRTAPAPGERRASAMEPARVDADVVLRALAILAVVAAHTDMEVLTGASIVLFALAGYAFGRLQLPAILRDDHAGRVWALIGRILVPLVPMSLLYAAFTSDLRFDPNFLDNIPYILPVRNYLDAFAAMATGRAEPSLYLVWLWFLHVYLQMFLVIGLLLSVPRLRRVLAEDAWRSLAVFFIVAEAISLAAVLALSDAVGGFASAATVMDKSATTILPFLIVGALFAWAKSPGRRAVSLALALAHLAYVNAVFPEHSEAWWLFALAACWLVPFVTLPRFVANGVVMIAAFSLMIYLIHPAVGNVVRVVAGDGALANAISFAVQLGAGVLAGLAMRPVLDRIGLARLARRRVSFPETRSAEPDGGAYALRHQTGSEGG